ncbi:potassium transporter KtrB [Deinococcus detaillensis]|uniref:Potassium transporter KtrB n=1 Tax=Deinococcus detaillensis TaxID=2592048 RepID=A0A553V3Q7_9DEIO|nr:TrkH family potassium uptake protein [Deinococcus detaillensis]TSA87120.1 potassium transporter KtrB [Deinococcus detaillensis]
MSWKTTLTRPNWLRARSQQPNRRRGQLSPAQLIALTYAGGILLGTLLLSLPGVYQVGQSLSLIQRLFTATSAICVTGLVVADTAETFSIFGQIILLLLIQVGGVGIITFGTLFAFLRGRRINFSERMQLAQQVQALDVGGVLPLIRAIFTYTLVAELIGTLLLWTRFGPEQGTWPGLYSAFFHAVSAYNSAGFVLGDFSRYVADPLISLTVTALIVLGGLGFLVQLNVLSNIHRPRQNRLLTYTKLTLTITGLLLVLGTLLIALTEWHNPKTLGPLPLSGKLLASLFQSATPRSAGFSTLHIASMQPASILVVMILMLIGASPGSTGGGIKTTTLAVLVGSAWNMVRGRGELVVFGRRIEPDIVVRAGTVTTLYAGLLLSALFVLMATNGHLSFELLLFEAISAAATVGLSLDVTHQINTAGLLLLTALMYLGRIGPLTFAVAFNLRGNTAIKYPAERDIPIG